MKILVPVCQDKGYEAHFVKIKEICFSFNRFARKLIFARVLFQGQACSLVSEVVNMLGSLSTGWRDKVSVRVFFSTVSC